MKPLILGALLGLLLAFPAPAFGIVAAAVAQPLLVAFGLGLVAGLRSRSLRRWAA
ncbi:hypothetical protein [Streptomyces sp. MK5]|uniref:hypothetical protein n=1 Tax=Streptomyces sp. MK5 TaxID=3064253 RepID=UPI00274143F3|nr:hypothetical protein [Streptomyces sp. MK5]